MADPVFGCPEIQILRFHSIEKHINCFNGLKMFDVICCVLKSKVAEPLEIRLFIFDSNFPLHKNDRPFMYLCCFP